VVRTVRISTSGTFGHEARKLASEHTGSHSGVNSPFLSMSATWNIQNDVSQKATVTTVQLQRDRRRGELRNMGKSDSGDSRKAKRYSEEVQNGEA